jgi:hypothetical protein
MKMKKSIVTALFLFVALNGGPLRAQDHKYPPIGEYLMAAGAETALAKSAAPPNVSDSATIKLLTSSGYNVADQGTNGFVCIVMRGFAAPTYTPAQLRDLVYDSALRAPICFDPNAARTVMPFYELRTKLGMEGKAPEQIAAGVQAAYARRTAQENRGQFCLYVVRRPESGRWSWSLASAHDGLQSVL